MITDRSNGLYLTLQEAYENKRRNIYVPASDGHVYHLREGEVLTVCRKANQVPFVPPLREGVRFNLPKKIPFGLLQSFISNARFYAHEFHVEFHAEIYWNRENAEYEMFIPKQLASKVNVEPVEELINAENALKFCKVLEIHSHHFWDASPSSLDDQNERGPILYAIVGKIDQYFPEVTLRTCLDGVHISVPFQEVFESPFQNNYERGTNPLPNKVQILSKGDLKNDII